MKAKLADKSGFCSGVKRAFEIANHTVREKGERKWYTLGPLVHNEGVVDFFRALDIYPVESLDELKEENVGIIVRSHGVSPVLLEEAAEKGIEIRDATCPLVKRVHDIVNMLHQQEYKILIFGDAGHPEVQGILGWCNQEADVISGVNDIDINKKYGKVGLVSQTTKNETEFLNIARILLEHSNELRVFNTICHATRERQEAAKVLSKEVDLMLVVGDRKSSNTSTLARECKNTGVRTYRIETAEDINPQWLTGVSRVGITAGASTPDWIIKEVVDRMTEFDQNDQQEQSQEAISSEESFARLEAEMAGLESPNRGDVIKGKVIEVHDDEVMVDVGGKSEGVIPRRELSVKDIDSAREVVNVGDEIEVLVLKWDDDGTILLSKKKVDSIKALDRLEQVYQENGSIEGTVIDTVKGGLLVDVGIVAFLPASHVEDGYVKDLTEYKGRNLNFKIIEFNRSKRRGSQVVLSRKELVAEQREAKKQEFWSKIAEGQTVKGTVKRIVDYGAFIDLGGFEGLLHVSEIDHKRVEHPGDVLKEGEEIEVYILGVDQEKERVSLSRKALLKSPWEIVLENYHEGDIIEGTVVRIAPFGAFVEIQPGVDGLVHISQLANKRVEKPESVVSIGQRVKIKILSIDAEEKRVGLSIKEAQEDIGRQEVDEYLQNQDNADNLEV